MSPVRRTAALAPLLALALCGCAERADRAEPADATTADKVRRLAGMLDYVAADYPGTVEGGALTEAGRSGEYAEQSAFLRDADAIAQELPAPGAELDIRGGIAAIAKQVDAKVPGPEVTASARALRAQILDAYDVVLAPTTTPSKEVAAELWATCVECHGQNGGGDGSIAHTMDPPPRNFLDAEILAEMAPVRAFNAITDGVDGTKMEAYGTLSPSQRWSLAFYVFTFRWDDDAAARGEKAFARAGKPLAATPSRLANQTDGQLLAALASAGLGEADARDALAYLRREAVFTPTGAPMDKARELVGAAVAAYRDGRTGDARRHAAAAYLDGFEPHEAALAGHDRDLVVKLEGEFLRFREATAEPGNDGIVEREALQIGALLDRADDQLRGGGGATAFAASFAIILREGLEGALLILLLLGIARRSGAGDEEALAVHYGWMAAVGVGVVTWFASSALLRAIGGAERELIEGLVALLAAVVLLAVSHFVLARLDAQRRVAALKERLERAVSSPRRKLVLASLAFIAVYREAFETVLFLQAILLDASASGWAVAAGAGAAAVLLIGIVFAMTRLGKRLRPGPLLTWLGMLLCVLAVALAGKGVRALQEAGVIGITPTGGPRFDWLGIYPTQETTFAQIAVFVAFLGLAAWALLKNRGAGPDRAAAGAPGR